MLKVENNLLELEKYLKKIKRQTNKKMKKKKKKMT